MSEKEGSFRSRLFSELGSKLAIEGLFEALKQFSPFLLLLPSGFALVAGFLHDNPWIWAPGAVAILGLIILGIYKYIAASFRQELETAKASRDRTNEANVTLTDQLDRIKRVSKIFVSNAVSNKITDESLFDNLGKFVSDDLVGQIAIIDNALKKATGDEQRNLIEELSRWGHHTIGNRRSAIETAIIDINNNLNLIVNDISQILGERTGDKVGVCIKLIASHPKPAKDRGDEILNTPFRDIGSKGDPHRSARNGAKYKVRDNTLTEEILCQNTKSSWACDNLRAYSNYRNPRPEWHIDYNATLGVGIPIKVGAEPRFCGVLVADNKKGGLEDELCESFMMEVSFRVSALLHRLYALDREAPKYGVKVRIFRDG
jgi:hypothetical protein